MKKLFKDNYPYLYAEVHTSKNIRADFSALYENSGLKIWWQCKKNPKHVWQQSITNRTKKNYGCPYCYGRKTLPEDSFAALYPKLASELHTDKNHDFDPYKYRPGSGKVVWWKCKNGHEYKQRITHRVNRKSICKVCRSLAKKYPKIAEEWHPVKNADLKPEDVFISSKEKVWWRCKEDPSHEWEVTVSTRVHNKTGCPICAINNKKILTYPNLDIYSPLLAQQWHPIKNDRLKPSDYKPNSSKKVWWVCPVNLEHEWESTIRNRALQNKGCPYCAKSRVTPENSLLIRFPIIAKQWHPTKNGSLKLAAFSYGSHKKVWWQCTKDKTHEWQSTITARTQRNKIECPICTQNTYGVSNTLQSVHPDIAAQWHPTKNNSLKPNQVTRASAKRVWWKCTENPVHEWKAQINNRTLLGAGCPICSKEKNIIRLSEHLFDLVHSEIDYYHVFLNNISTLRKLSEQDLKGRKRLKQPYYRMIYSSTITSLETYLSDAFYKKVSINNELLEKFIATNPEFGKRQYSLTEVIDWHKNLKERVTDYLFNIIWHNLPKIQNMYKDVLGVNFPEDISDLHRAVAIRHDIVHRNGRTKSGSIHHLDKSQLLNLISDVKDFVSYINRQLLRKIEPGASPDG
jgi:putative zinc ribbon protein/HEPN superfamily RiboL-PSP-like protein